MTPDFSIVSTMYKSRDFLEAFLAQCLEVAARIGGQYEIVLVNDGSPDNSVEYARARQKCTR